MEFLVEDWKIDLLCCWLAKPERIGNEDKVPSKKLSEYRR